MATFAWRLESLMVIDDLIEMRMKNQRFKGSFKM
jgi:hypothetical protein